MNNEFHQHVFITSFKMRFDCERPTTNAYVFLHIISPKLTRNLYKRISPVGMYAQFLKTYNIIFCMCCIQIYNNIVTLLLLLIIITISGFLQTICNNPPFILWRRSPVSIALQPSCHHPPVAKYKMIYCPHSQCLSPVRTLTTFQSRSSSYILTKQTRLTILICTPLTYES